MLLNFGLMKMRRGSASHKIKTQETLKSIDPKFVKP